mmetsp:Transcript_72486/g.204915  ORF Transcript_72486/g.204915 Transcript_72486/m.204915 type:complete len:305 (-) Transcript_72486:114-1028(-)
MAAVECVFFDCDDCLYRNGWATAGLLNAKFGEYCQVNLGVPESRMMELFRAHGTTLCGLVREGHLQDAQVPDFLREVHDVPLDADIRPDPRLRRILQALPLPRWVFTAATREHAERCVRRLGIDDLFLGVIACSSPEMIERVGYVSKHDPRCFEAAMDFAGVPRARAAGCMLLDDSATNLKTAKAVGWHTVLVGRHGRDGSPVTCPAADFTVDTLHEIEQAVPLLFRPGTPVGGAAATRDVDGKAEKTVEVLLGTGRRLKRRRELKPLVSSPARRVLRRRSTLAEIAGEAAPEAHLAGLPLGCN